MKKWTVQDSNDLYLIDRWGAGFFRINDSGNVEVCPDQNGARCDLSQIVESLQRRGVDLPILFRFDGIIKQRVATIQNAFANAITECKYEGKYHLAYPIKVNQQSHVVEAVRRSGVTSPIAIEVGSKPELLAALAIHDAPNGLLICNGYKDSDYIELAIIAAKLGRQPIIVIEQPNEVDLVLQLADRLNHPISLGVRMKPAAKGAGRWEESGGDKAKFGLTAYEILEVIEQLKKAGKGDWLKLLHYHAGSQITSIAAIKRVLKEATRMYVQIAELCPSLRFFDAGGGLGVDYDGSRSSFHSSINYTEAEYAMDLVYEIEERCTEMNIPHPDIITESGRATVAHHAVLVAEVTDVTEALGVVPKIEKPPTRHQLLRNLVDMYQDLTIKNCRETLHDTIEVREEILEQFNRGDLSLVERAYADRVLKHLVAKLHSFASELKRPLEELEKLRSELYDLYYCNFSVFQSLPDFWAIDQLFPIMPIHRLKEEPTREALMADLTCDSDGKIDCFIDPKGTRRSLKLHPFNPKEQYCVAFFLVGAYQEILGDMHNLFGDTNAVHVTVAADGSPEFTHVLRGDTMREVLEYVQFSVNDLIERFRVATENALRGGLLTPESARELQKIYREALDGYTYLIKEEATPTLSVAKSNGAATSAPTPLLASTEKR